MSKGNGRRTHRDSRASRFDGAQRPERGGRQVNACGFRTEAAIRVKAEERGWWRARRTAGECGTTDADQPIDERDLASADAG